MSTRAIIALPTDNGYETAWCWNDGYPSGLGQELRKYFMTKELVKVLINTHSFSSIMGPKAKKELLELFPETISEENFVKLPNNRFLKIDNHHGNVVAGGNNGFFPSIKEMLQEDLNYVYVFENGKWKTYK